MTHSNAMAALKHKNELIAMADGIQLNFVKVHMKSLGDLFVPISLKTMSDFVSQCVHVSRFFRNNSALVAFIKRACHHCHVKTTITSVMRFFLTCRLNVIDSNPVNGRPIGEIILHTKWCLWIVPVFRDSYIATNKCNH